MASWDGHPWPRILRPCLLVLGSGQSAQRTVGVPKPEPWTGVGTTEADLPAGMRRWYRGPDAHMTGSAKLYFLIEIISHDTASGSEDCK